MTETPPNTETIDSNMLSNLETNPHNPASPNYIQPGEGASFPLVLDLLTTENYVTWARVMRRALNIKNKLGFIDSIILKPSNSADPLYAPWERCNDMVIAWIQHLVSLEHRSGIVRVETAASVWNDLCERFSIQNAPRIFHQILKFSIHLTKSISSLTQDDDSISQYYNKSKSFWDELEIYEPMPSCTCGAVKTLTDYTHRRKVMQFLMGLNDSYDSMRAQILLNDPLPTLNCVLSLVQQEERHRQLHSSPAPIGMGT
ncbi:uncharacterized protein LOC121259625 [Juglans microcarpa x Juglans regia]|uniref:uncharacterized protein LOC121259625 n=1 Tax=Juglans microcarpa x Juglans regia TaxID=2249226 RepID=UPI001B7E7302|nr:uncharacterized protein LOC121259625 [Juglans microcarpa x Juglans regia]